MKLKVIDALLVQKIVADYTDNPPAFAVRGRFLSLNDAVHQMTSNQATACYVRLGNFKLKSGETLNIKGINTGTAKNQKELYFATLYHNQDRTQNGIFVVCLSKRSAVTYSGIVESLAGMIEIIR
jgi:hypothetical protein